MEFSLPYFVLYCITGLIIMAVWRKTPYCHLLNKFIFFKELFECNLCFGTWVWMILAFIFPVNILYPIYFFPANELLTGLVTSFVMWIFVVGWNEIFGIIKI